MSKIIRKIQKIKIIRVEIDIEFIKPIMGRLLIPFLWVWCTRVFSKEIYRKKFYMICIPKFYFVK